MLAGNAVPPARPGGSQIEKRRLRMFFIYTRGGQYFAIVEIFFALGAVPSGNFIGRPARVVIFVTVIAGVRRTDFYRQIRPWDTQAVVATSVDQHIGFCRHMAVSALTACGVLRVKMMRW